MQDVNEWCFSQHGCISEWGAVRMRVITIIHTIS